MSSRLSLIASSIAIVLISACGSDSTGPAKQGTGSTGAPPDLAGSWTGIVGGQVLALTLINNGGTVSGVGTISNTPSGLRALTVAGTFATPSALLTLSSGTIAPISLSASLNVNTLTGSLAGSGFSGDAIALFRVSSNAAPNQSAWVGTYVLVTDQGQPPGAAIAILGYPTRVASRTLLISGDGTGTWSDSTLSGLLCVPPTQSGSLCNASGTASIAWAGPTSSSLTVVRSTNTGFVAASKSFVRQQDGTLLKTDDSQVEIYRKQ
jgi:hypothetical protein